MNVDLTTGNPSKVLWRFCLPLFASTIFQQLYNIADSFVAGRFIGEDALAAVGNSYEVTLIFIAIAMGINLGCSVVVSQRFGAKNYSELKSAVYTTLIIAGILCASLMGLGFWLCDDLLHGIQTPENVLADSKLYLDIYIAGLPFMLYYNIATGIFSALGDAKTPFYFLAASSVCNVLINILFVAIFRMGVAGVAWATFMCQGASCILSMIVVLQRLKNMTSAKSLIFSWPLLAETVSVAVPCILQQSLVSVSNILIQSTVNSFGSAVMAGYSAAIKLNNMFISGINTMGNGICSYTAQNIGAKRMDRISMGYWAGLKMIWSVCLPIFLLYFFFNSVLLQFFMEDIHGEAMDAGIRFLKIASPFYFVVSAKVAADGVLRGTKMMNPLFWATCIDLTIRAVVGRVFSSWFGSTGIWLSWPFGWTTGAILSTVSCLLVAKKKLPVQELDTFHWKKRTE